MSAPFQSYSRDTAYLTVVASNTGPVNKKIYLQDNKICKDPNAQIYQGFAKTVPATTSAELSSLISNLKQNEAIAELVTEIDEAMDKQAYSVNLLHSPFPTSDFRAVKAKVRGSRYFAQVYVRVEGHETPVMALQRILGDEMAHIEVK